jgi:hypothetical protein
MFLIPFRFMLPTSEARLRLDQQLYRSQLKRNTGLGARLQRILSQL